MLTPSMGINGSTSVAPTRGCAPLCFVRSISSTALPVPRSAASATASGSPASVTTERLWSASISRSSTYTPDTLLIAATIASTFAASRPSEKFGTHSINRFVKRVPSFLRHIHHRRFLAPQLLTCRFLENRLALFQSHPALVHAKVVGNLPIIFHIKDCNIRLFASLQRSNLPIAPQGISRVYRCCHNRFRWSHAQLRARQRQNHWHAQGRTSSRIVVRSHRDDRSCIDQGPRRRILFQSKVKIASRQQRRHRIRLRQRSHVRLADLLQMIAARRSKLHGQLRRTRPGQLFRMNSRQQSVFLTRLQNDFRIFACQRPAVAENIAKFCQFSGSDFRNQPVRHQRNVLPYPTRLAPVLRRQNVSAKKCRHNLNRLLEIQFPLQPQNLQFATYVQPVTALSLQRRGSMRREFPQRSSRPLLQRVTSSRPQLLHRIQNPATLASNLLIAGACNFQFVFFRPASRMNQVGMRIDKSRHHHTSAHIDFLSGPRLRQRLHFRTRTHSRDHAIANQQCAISKDAEVGKRFAAPRCTPAKRKQLRSTSNEQAGRQVEEYYAPVAQALDAANDPSHGILKRSQPSLDKPAQKHPAQKSQTKSA